MTRPLSDPTTRLANRTHWLNAIKGSGGLHRSADEPVFYSHARELDDLEDAASLTTIERDRMTHLRHAREQGSIADRGEGREAVVAERGSRSDGRGNSLNIAI